MPVQESVPQKNEEITSTLLKGTYHYFNMLMEKACKDGNAVWQEENAKRQQLETPVLLYKDKEGEYQTFYPPVANALPAMQVQKNIGSKDACWISAKEAAKDPHISIKEGARSLDFVLFTKEKKPYVKKFFNRADLTGKGVPTIEVKPNIARDAYTHDMVNYLARRAERGTFKDDNYFMMFLDAKEAANRSYKAKKELYDFAMMDYAAYQKAEIESGARLSAILQTDVSKKPSPKDQAAVFRHLLAQELRTRSATNYVVRAAKKALGELKWQEKHVKKALCDLVPNAAFDDLARKGKAPSAILLASAKQALAENRKAQER